MYKLGSKSQKELVGVHDDLADVVRKAITITKQDFTVFDGVRTIAEQEENIKKGVSKTINSLHIPQKDGFSHAVDLVPYIDGSLKWDAKACCVIAQAVQQAARELKVDIVWGACWDKLLNVLTSDMEKEAEQYAARRKALNRTVFLDYPHFQLSDKYRR